MYIQEKRLMAKAGEELKKRIPLLSDWKVSKAHGHIKYAVDMLATAKFKGRRYHFCIEIKRAGYPQYIREGASALKKFIETNHSYCPIIIVPFIGERGRKICDEYNIGYCDFSGNTKIVCGSIFIYTQGNERPKDAAPVSQSIFSPKAARITKFLLSRPNLKWIQRDIVRETGLSKGLVSRVVAKMSEDGFVTKKDGKLVLTNFNDLFSSWVESEARRRENKRNYYVWAQNPQKLMKSLAGKLFGAGINYAFTQESGASLVAPFATFDIVSVYVESLDRFPEKALSASRVEKGFNLTVIEAPDAYIFTRAREKGGLRVVDSLQLYADLKKNPLRGEKQAGHILTLIEKKLR